MRRRPFQASIVVVTTVLLLGVAIAPGVLSLAPQGGRVGEDWLAQRFSDQPEEVVQAIEFALGSNPASVDQFVGIFLGELGDMDLEAARDVLAKVLPRLSLERFLNGNWLVDLPLLLKSDRAPSARDVIRVIPKMAVLRSMRAVCATVLSHASWSTGSTLTRWQIRHLSAADPLGP